jgi:tryptophan-rich sensory protein
MKFKVLLKSLREFYNESAVNIDSPELKKLYDKNRLNSIRENWKLVLLVLKIVTLCAWSILMLSDDDFMVARTIAMAGLFALFLLLEKLIKTNDFVANYAGCLLVFCLTVMFTEVNAKIEKYRYDKTLFKFLLLPSFIWLRT